MARDGLNSNIQTQALINEYIQLAALAILYYDYLLTFKDEIARYWRSRSKLNPGFGLFILNRYLSILGNIPVLLLSFWTWPSSNRLQLYASPSSEGPTCVGLSQYQEYLIAAVHVVVDSIVRTYAIYESSRRIFVLLIAAGAALLGYAMHAIITAHQQNAYTVSDLPAAGCLLPTPPELSSPLADVWTGLLCFDVLIFSLTLYKSLTEKRQNFSILTVMLRDGTVYFGVMILTCTSVIVSFRILPAYLQGLTAPLASVLATTMISRLMLNLRSLNLNYAPEDQKRSATSQLVFEIGVNTMNTPHLEYFPEELTSRSDHGVVRIIRKEINV